MARAITIVGGGLAGLTLGIALRQRAVNVSLLEAGQYPRHRVCGEFLSGSGVKVLQELGLLDRLLRAGAQAARTVSFHARERSSKIHPLPFPALCLSRHRLDQVLATEFRKIGGDLHEKSRWSEDFAAAGIIRATGRRAQQTKSEQVIGLKVHARNLPLISDLEMHFTPRAYFGLCRIEDEKVNICGLFRLKGGEKELAKERHNLFMTLATGALRERLSGAQFDLESFCSVAALPLWEKPRFESGEWPLGDAIAMIPPITGNGMSLAIESANLSVEPAAEFVRESLSWLEARGAVQKLFQERFRRRLRWAAGVHHLLFAPGIERLLPAALGAFPGLVPLLFHKTRS